MDMKSLKYAHECVIYDDEVDGLGPWIWPKSDRQTYSIIKSEWEQIGKVWVELCKEKNVVVQAGGNCGMYPRLFAQHFERVYTFEPDPLNFNCLVSNCQLDHVYKYHAALGDTHEMVKLDRSVTENVGMVKVSDEGTYLVPTLMIDDFNLDACDLMQLDVECYELNVLRGAKNTIARHKPIISTENGNDEILEYLKTFGDYQHLKRFVVGYNSATKEYRHEDIYGIV